MTLRNTIRLARPKHWVKNVFVLAPIVFSLRTWDTSAWARVGLAIAAFCCASSVVYIINDLRDRAGDRLHPQKRHRPLAAGEVSVRAALVEAGVLLAGALALAWSCNLPLLGVVVAYLLLQTAYTFFLKYKMLVDVMCIALGFVLRAVAGAVAIPVAASQWLIICTFAICLFLGFCKRANEIATLGGHEGGRFHRHTLAGYRADLLTHLITLSAGLAVVSFLLYASSDWTVGRFHTVYLSYTVPLILYAVCRFAMLSMRGVYADPTDLILRDRPFQLTTVLWVFAAVLIILWGRDLQAWMRANGVA